MEEKSDYLYDLFIEEAKPALDRHSGGGGGSGDLVNVTELPTTEVEEGKIYMVKTGDNISIGVPTTSGDSAAYFWNGTKWQTKVGEFLSTIQANKLFYQNTKLTIDALRKLIAYNDTSDVTDMWGMFSGCTALTSIPEIDTSNVTSMGSMFADCTALVNIPKMNTSNVTNMSYMFKGCEALTSIPEIDTSNATHMNYMFSGCTSLTVPLKVNTSNATDISQIFSKCTNLTTIPEIDLTNCASSSGIFLGCTSLTSLASASNIIWPSEIIASKLPNSMFNGCTGLTDISGLDYTKMVSLSSTFCNCSGLKRVHGIDLSKVTSMQETFRDCTSLTEVYDINTPSCTVFNNTFNGCTSLQSVRGLDMRNAAYQPYTTKLANTFYNCSKLSELSIKNIANSLTIGSGTSYGHLLTVDSLVGIIYELREMTAALTLTVGTANLEKLTSVYVKLVDVTDEMRVEDDWIDAKYPFEVCESTDEGAMLIADYVGLKNWALK